MTTITLSDSPVIAAVKNEEQLSFALASECETVFLLCGDILNIGSLCARVREADKHPIVHLDLVNGLAPREIAVDFIRQTTCAEGIISTKPPLIRRAKELGLFTVLRVFVIDSRALEAIERERSLVEPDVIEILPGVMPDIIRKISGMTPTPLIAGGLISTKQEIMAALGAGAIAVSTTNRESWQA
ncbi:MAG: glycerol-3-phosphate responsive antiterminator [Clostridia bacterium]|nr:glycerol-3-phosphate responsive antiterminator [Clostridia bacterium]